MPWRIKESEWKEGRKLSFMKRVKKSLRLHPCSESLRKANGETQVKNLETSVQSSPTLAFTELSHWQAVSGQRVAWHATAAVGNHQLLQACLYSKQLFLPNLWVYLGKKPWVRHRLLIESVLCEKVSPAQYLLIHWNQSFNLLSEFVLGSAGL